MAKRLSLTAEAKAARLREQNRRSQARHRQKKKARDVAQDLRQNQRCQQIDAKEKKVIPTALGSTPLLWEAAKAGELAAYLSLHLRSGHPLVEEAAMRIWLANPIHSLGEAIVLRLLSSAGLADDFKRWRGTR